MGAPVDREFVRLNDNKFSLYYEHAETNIPGCNNHNPSTTITFICPREGPRIGESRAPVVTSDYNCQFQVEWQTEYACETEMLTSHTCVLDSDKYGIDIDLAPLQKAAGSNYHVKTTGYDYYVNVCENACDSKPDAGVCQLATPDVDAVEKNAGSFGNNLQTLSYVDGELSLTYKGGNKCSSGFERTSVITFKCNVTADVGSPTFITETSCTYFFEWHTRYACHEHPTCQVTVGKKRYDLGLLDQEGKNWVALNSDEVESGTFILNVCDKIVRDETKNVGSTKCGTEDSACYIEGSDVKDIGVFKSSPVFEDNHLTLKYTKGGPCDNKKQISTIITFSCSPGDLESAPVFTRKSSDGCMYEFEWRTAAACPQEEAIKSHSCTAYDDERGLIFDLTPLQGQEYTAKVNSTEYNYYIGVCERLTQYCIGSDTGACQFKNEDKTSHITGKINSNTTLEYYNGVLKLTYFNGDPYHAVDGEPREYRRTEIVFICDHSQADSSPEYVSENNHSYFFEWSTMYACPQKPVECIVRKGSQQYDLSSLSGSDALDDDNWSIIDDSIEGHQYKYYLHVCKPLKPVAGCDVIASSCMTEIVDGKEVQVHGNLGVSKTSPVIESVGHVKLTYSNGDSCDNGKVSETRIHFICEKGALATSPRLLEKIDGCDYIFEWKTEAACSIETSSGKDCTVRDVNSGYIFNLSPLKLKGAYSISNQSISNGDSIFKINICGAVPSGNCNGVTDAGACQIDGNSIKVLGRTSSNLTFTDDGHLSLVYDMPFEAETGNRNSTVEITFLCRHEVSGNHHDLTFLRKDDNKWLFNFETPYACLPQAVDCLISDSHGNEYNLTPLSKEDGNWEVVDTRDESSDLRYHINVCRPLNNDNGYNCPGGAIGSCQTSTKGGSPRSLGYIQSMPEAAPDGSISIQYENGDVCKDGIRYSTRIIFECSDRPGSPVLQVVSNGCEYVFSWQTPAACPLKTDTGSNCVVQDPELGFQFNLSSLHNPKDDYVVTSGEYEYRINPCGNLVNPSGSCNKPGVGACQSKDSGSAADSFQKVAGMGNTKLVYEGGHFKLNYTDGEACHKKVYKRSTAFIFYCDKQVKGAGEPKFINETSDCTYVFEWATSLACPPFELVECSYRNSQGTQFDLSSLTHTKDNYKVMPFYQTTAKPDIFYINICRPLVHSHNVEGSKCAGNSAACLQTGTAENPTYADLGHISGPPSWINNHLSLTYEGGDPCTSVGETLRKKTTIAFICDKDSEATGPEYAYSGSSCFYHFNWFTELACGLDEEVVTNDCTVNNPATGYRFDLSSLNKAGGYSVSGGGYIYKLNICEKLTGSGCTDENIGVCQQKPAGAGTPHSYDAGHFNKRLSFDDGILMLNYEGGKPCHRGQFNRSSIINFVCPHTDGVIGQPQFVDESEDCTYYFSWHTSLACENQISCKATNGDTTIDLSPLVNEQGYYLSRNMDPYQRLSAIYLNPCRPLNPIPGTRCPPSAAGCVVAEGKSPFSIGKLSSPPVLYDNGTVTLTYTNGSKCDENKNYTTIIQFSCKPGTSEGIPELTSVYDCTYRFIWMTNRVCPPSKSDPITTDCKFMAANLDYTFDLTPLSSKVEELPEGYSIHVCQSVSSECDGAVCQKGTSLGSAKSQEFSYNGHNLKVVYSNGDSCPHGDGKRRSEIIFECDESQERGKPQLVTSDDEACFYSFIWKSNFVCPPMHQPCHVANGNKLYDLHSLSRLTSSWEVKSNKKKIFYVNICTAIMNGPKGCDESAAVCSEDGNVVEILGKEYTQILITDADTNSLQMDFKEGKSTECSGKNVDTAITFTCGKKIGTPDFTGLSENGANCVYNFKWQTRVACPEEIATVEGKNWKFTDPETNKDIDIHELKSKQHTAEEKRGETTYEYYISLDGDVRLPEGEEKECKGAAICQTSGTFQRNVGSSSTKKFYISDGTLEMVVTKPKSCGKGGGDVNSTIIFQCDESVGLGKPEFQYESIKCHYFFIWKTNRVCTTTSDRTSLSSEVGKSHPAGIIIAVFVTLVLICCLALYFHEHNRRASFARSIKRCFPGGYSNIPSYKYTKLSSDEEGIENELLQDVTPKHSGQQQRDSFFNDADDELLGDVHPSPIAYHDDSDEELLPTI
ncbi:cation-independent mannose-6-phosphate receptor-like [Antedon mediterranea]|uniref:cation-independent mannose-6-phosphate receptor-like n=1 Tax=Antedon mediterranea TaxID=105859 RepID=UPI003AF7639C